VTSKRRIEGAKTEREEGFETVEKMLRDLGKPNSLISNFFRECNVEDGRAIHREGAGHLSEREELKRERGVEERENKCSIYQDPSVALPNFSKKDIFLNVKSYFSSKPLDQE